MPFSKTWFLTLAGLLVFATSVAPQEDVNPSGNWNFILSDSSVAGVCPMGGDGSGSMSIIDQGGGAFLLTYVQGMACDPAQVCDLYGSCEGPECVFSTTVTVDEEGGEVTNTANLNFMANHAVGTGSSVYRHPGGMECSWTYLLTVTRQ